MSQVSKDSFIHAAMLAAPTYIALSGRVVAVQPNSHKWVVFSISTDCRTLRSIFIIAFILTLPISRPLILEFMFQSAEDKPKQKAVKGAKAKPSSAKGSAKGKGKGKVPETPPPVKKETTLIRRGEEEDANAYIGKAAHVCGKQY